MTIVLKMNYEKKGKKRRKRFIQKREEKNELSTLLTKTKNDITPRVKSIKILYITVFYIRI